MNSKEIKEIQQTELSERAWMREIALQLALLREMLTPRPVGRPKKAA